MNEFLVKEFRKLGADQISAVLASQVYLELCEVKRYWNPEYEYNSALQKIIIRAKKRPSEEFSVFLPIPSYEQLSFIKLQDFLISSNSNSIFLSIVHPDSTCVYYQISKDLIEPTESTAKHLRVNKQEKVDAELRKHRQIIEQAALLGIPVTLAKDKPKEPQEVGVSGESSSVS